MTESQPVIYVFPVAFLLNASSMTILLIVVGVMGHPELAAEIAIVQGATLAVFFAFSANARSVILGESSKISLPQILWSRVLLLIPIGAAALVISFYLTEATPTLALALVIRRCTEWISEIYLAGSELDKNYSSALWFIAMQSLLLAVAIVSAIADFPFSTLGIFLWAIVPMALSIGFLKKHFRLWSLQDSNWVHMLPHFGSTAITGITVFVFRLIVLLLVGKANAGNLFTAFAIGGILGTVFAQALGPTLVFHAKEGLVSDIPKWLKGCLLASTTVGIAIVLTSAANWQLLLETGRSPMFWSAIGASLIGGAVMVIAQRFRLRLLQHHENVDAFGPDVLTNIFIVACVPYVYYLLGIEALSGLFLINAIIALVFYVSANRTVSPGMKVSDDDGPILKQIIAAGLVFPIFFQLTGRIFRDRGLILDSGGELISLPISISVLICYGAIVVIGNYGRARTSLAVIFLCFCLMFMTTVLSTHGHANLQEAKIILLIQFILPMFALVLGQTYGGTFGAERNFAKACLYVVALIIPLQLIATWNQDLHILSSYLYVVSVYQHLQYVPVILECAFVIACFSLWTDKVYRMVLMLLAAPAGAYATLSTSTTAVGGLLIGSVTFVAYQNLRRCGKTQTAPLFLLLMVVVGIYSMIPVVYPVLGGMGKAQNFFERIQIWQFYLGEISSSGSTWAIGHGTPPDRELYSSAHNYYLDFTYNFGLVALSPIMCLIAITIWRSGRYWKRISVNPEFLALTGTVLLLVLVDNSIKVGLRQPYPGIVTFFLWGMLLSRLSELGRSRGTHGTRE